MYAYGQCRDVACTHPAAWLRGGHTYWVHLLHRCLFLRSNAAVRPFIDLFTSPRVQVSQNEASRSCLTAVPMATTVELALSQHGHPVFFFHTRVPIAAPTLMITTQTATAAIHMIIPQHRSHVQVTSRSSAPTASICSRSTTAKLCEDNVDKPL